MRAWTLTLPLTCGLILVPLASARALVMAPPPLPVRVAQADAVVVGRVVGIEPRDVAAAPFPGSPAKVPFRVAVVQVNDPVRGAKAGQVVRVGFPAPAAVDPPPGRRPPPRRFGPQLDAGQDGLFILSKHAAEDFYVLPQPAYFVPNQGNADFAKEVEQVKRLARVLDDPTAKLKAADAEDRFLAAAVLIATYRARRPGATAEAPIPADESRLILRALAGADWDPTREPDGQRLTPFDVFYQLGITQADGYGPDVNARDRQEIADRMRDWLRRHGDTYRIRRYAPRRP